MRTPTRTGPDHRAADMPRAPARRLPGAAAFRTLWAASAAVPAIALVLAGFWVWDAVVAYQARAMTRTLGMINEQILRALETQNAVLAALEAHIEGMTWDGIKRDPLLQHYTERLTGATSTVLSTTIIGPDGRVAVSSDTKGSPRGLDLSGQDFVRAFPAGSPSPYTYIGAVLADPVTGRVEVHIAHPHRAPDGRADGGVLCTAFAPRYFEKFFGEVAESPRTGFTLVRQDGSVLARFPDPVTTAGERLDPDDPALVSARATGHGGEVAFIRSGSLFAGFGLTAVRHVGGYPVLIAHSLDPAVARHAWLSLMTAPAIATLIAMALLLALTAQAQRRMQADRDALMRRTEIAEAGQALAQTRAELSSRLRQTEKVAALGQLAAGVAHDFNNLLQSIMASAESLGAPGLSGAEIRGIAELILKASDRGAALTRRMLDYARRDDASDEDTDVAASLRDVYELLSRSLGRLHRLRIEAAAVEGLRARGHPAEFETVLINLVANARDAMPDGGEIVVAVTRTDATQPGATQPGATQPGATQPGATRPGAEGGLAPGHCVRVTVTDFGQGMDGATITRAGEAFFTTKPPGQGTGLGLSMARGYARRAGGRLELASTPGRGTVVTLWLPARD